MFIQIGNPKLIQGYSVQCCNCKETGPFAMHIEQAVTQAIKVGFSAIQRPLTLAECDMVCPACRRRLGKGDTVSGVVETTAHEEQASVHADNVLTVEDKDFIRMFRNELGRYLKPGDGNGNDVFRFLHRIFVLESEIQELKKKGPSSNG